MAKNAAKKVKAPKGKAGAKVGASTSRTFKARGKAPKVKFDPAEAVTLAQAKKMARARGGIGSARTTDARANELARLSELGASREALEEARQKTNADRQSEYADLLDVIANKGLRIQVASGESDATTEEIVTRDPVRMLAEGDSWFDYPLFAKGGIIPRLEKRLGVGILNMAKAGDEVRYMLGVKQRLELIDRLKKGPPGGGKWEVLFFSGGGNDIVGDPMALWVRDWDPKAKPEDLLDAKRYQAALDLVMGGYEDLVAVRNSYSPDTHIVVHAYDIAFPNGAKACHFFGPWLKPSFDLRGFPASVAKRRAVVAVMLNQFAKRLDVFQKAHKNIIFINKQGTLNDKSAWHNELHPSEPGFDLMADAFAESVRKVLPKRVKAK